MSETQITAKISDEQHDFVPVHLEMRFNGTYLSSATGFVIRYGYSTFLVTNWHNVSGREPETGICKSPTGGVPNEIVLTLPLRHPEAEGSVCWKRVTVPLYLDEDNVRPRWFEHPFHGAAVDVVALPLSGIGDTELRVANDRFSDSEDVPIRSGLDVFILGFPRDLNGGAMWPIWKRGSIASNPAVDIDGLPKLLIDSATREGMSGAPVYAQETRFWAPLSVRSQLDVRFGVGRKLLGIYSGRLGSDIFKAQLGIVWTTAAILEIVAPALETYLERSTEICYNGYQLMTNESLFPGDSE